MENNSIIRSLRYTFDLSDAKMIEIFGLADFKVSRTQVCDWLKKDDAEGYEELSDSQLAIFLNGFINDKRGKKEGAQPEPEIRLNNNIIFRKLKIALDFKDTDILEILDSMDMKISRHELSAFFRKPGQKQFRNCNDQILRNFMNGIKLKYRSDPA
ncbi:MAG: DUF1456 family protein [Bacteroidetes bacterium]|jgi:uncharacterized protein YehS (DUF1456 family)|nr:DUF1456 family protein [Bacteroidota bacterium]MBT3422205.1 DUF1456 family protein [Bacteroidota bacterium]MBT3801420.1 DUF1456 family protein [Bacteroidota bacterium]MBT4339768.1 DUF1456 family protein [Bacteroidota bacterium]MBT4728282.1 DUF1456 family protein [Bacteroidota bacterium]